MMTKIMFAVFISTFNFVLPSSAGVVSGNRDVISRSEPKISLAIKSNCVSSVYTYYCVGGVKASR